MDDPLNFAGLCEYEHCVESYFEDCREPCCWQSEPARGDCQAHLYQTGDIVHTVKKNVHTNQLNNSFIYLSIYIPSPFVRAFLRPKL